MKSIFWERARVAFLPTSACSCWRTHSCQIICDLVVLLSFCRILEGALSYAVLLLRYDDGSNSTRSCLLLRRALDCDSAFNSHWVSYSLQWLCIGRETALWVCPPLPAVRSVVLLSRRWVRPVTSRVVDHCLVTDWVPKQLLPLVCLSECRALISWEHSCCSG